MKVTTHIARILLGLIFFVLGLNPFLHFLPARLPSGLAGQFLNLLIQSHYVFFVGAVQLVGGVLLLVNRYVPLALTLLGPVIVNILLYHFLLSPAWRGVSHFRHDSLGISVFSSPSTLLQPVCAADLLNISSNIPTAMTEEALCRLDATPVFAAVVAHISV